MPYSQPPPDIVRADIRGLPITYSWSSDVSDRMIWADDERHPGLGRSLGPLGSRMGMALLAAVAEWVAWRYAGIVDIDDALQRVEAGYAAAIDPTRVRLPMPSEPFPKENGKAHGPLKLARMLLSMGFEEFSQGGGALLARASSAILLARHVLPSKNPFNAWLRDVLRRGEAWFPRTPRSDQLPIAPSFFEKGADPTVAELTAHMEAFVRRLSPSTNPYLLPSATDAG